MSESDMWVRVKCKVRLRRHDGALWCAAGRKQRTKNGGKVWKRAFASIDEAWLYAFLVFVRLGVVLTPYRCAAIVLTKSRLIVIPHPNPWSFEAWWVKLRFENLRRRHACGRWHLTSSSHNALSKGN